MTTFYTIVVLAVLLLALLLNREWTRVNTRMRGARCLATIFLMAALLGLSYPKQVEHAKQGKALILLTPGYSEDSIAVYKILTGESDSIFSVEGADKGIPVTDLRSFLSNHEGIPLHIFGNGLSEENVNALDNRPVSFHPNVQRSSITAIFWKQDLLPGEPLAVQGRFCNSQQPVQLLLRAYGISKDSLSIPAGADTSFELHALPAEIGTGTYELVSIEGRDTIAREPVPFMVTKGTGLRLMILSSAPDFDNTYLKNALSGLGYTVTMLTSVSTGKREQQQINQNNQTVDKSPGFDQFDIVLADPQALAGLGASQLQDLRASINEKGVGLIIKTDTSIGNNSFFGAGTMIKHVQESKPGAGNVIVSTSDSSRYPLPAGNRLALIASTEQRVLLTDAGNNCLAALQRSGNGKIISTTLQNSFSIALSGNRNAYLQLWSALLNEAGTKAERAGWQISPFPGFENEPQFIRWETELPDSTASAGNALLSFGKDSLLPSVRHTVYWPSTAGWQAVQSAQSRFNWYVFPGDSWQQLRNYHRRKSTADFASRHIAPRQTGITTNENSPTSYTLLFLITFLGAAAFLWVEQKL